MPNKNFGVLKNEFLNLDSNSSGNISIEDFKRCLSIGEMKATPNLVEFLVSELDNK
jgi:Ca2+-binding EF-hand superfamily protein